MFSDLHAQSSTILPSDPQSKLVRRMTVLGMAIALAMPVTHVMAQDMPAPTAAAVPATPAAPADPKAALTAGIDTLKAGQYEEAATALGTIAPASLGADDQKLLADSLAQAQQGATARQGARADFDKAQAALAAGDYVTATNLFKSVASNTYADTGTKAKATEQLAVAEQGVKDNSGSLKTQYDAAVASYKAGQFEDAKTKFTALQAAGYKASWFDKTPQDYLNDIDRQMSGVSPAEQARSAYLNGRDQFNKGDWIAARGNFNKAVELNYKPGWFEDAPAKYLARMDKKENADREKWMMEHPEVAAAPTAVGTTAATPPTDSATATTPAATDTTATTPAAADPNAALRAQQLADQQNKLVAADLVAKAKAAADGGKMTSATELYAQALEKDPTNADAKAGQAAILNQQGLNAPVAIDQRFAEALQARHDALQFSFNRAIEGANVAIGAGSWDLALKQIEQAAVATRADMGVFSNSELVAMDQTLADTRGKLATARETEKNRVQGEVARTAQTTADEMKRLADTKKLEEISALTAQAQDLQRRGDYAEAIKTINQILALDHHNAYANGIRQILIDQESLRYQRDTREKMGIERMVTLNQVDEKMIPYSDIMTYPTNWPDLSARRDQTVRDERNINQQDEATVALLDKPLPELRFQDVAFPDVIDFLRDTTQANIFVNWKALEAAGIAKDTQVSIRLRNVKFSVVLKTILESIGGGTNQLGYTVADGVITISTQEELAKNVETQTYDIRDLIISIPDFTNAPTFDLNNTSSNGSSNGGNGGQGGQGGGGQRQGLFGGSGGSNNQNNNENAPDRTALVDQITKLIKDTIGTGTWKDEGGQLGSLSELGGQLIVTQTPENHRQISLLLEKLRETRALQVMIEARFLTVQRNFLEDVGVDFDFFFNFNNNPFATGGPLTATGGATSPTAPFYPTSATGGTVGTNIGAYPTDPLTGQAKTGVTPVSVTQNSATFTQASALQTGVNGNLGADLTTPAIQTTISAFLDDFQANLFIRATQGSQYVTQLTAPRVTLFNGQRAYLFVTRQIAYVSDLTPVVATGAVGYDPTVDLVNSGVVLDVSATVSADRKYVTLTLRPQLSRVIAIRSFPVLNTTNNGNNNNGGGDTTTGTGFLQQPEIEVTGMNTTVSVPDGGTLLLGGTTISGEIEREAGVPVLSKIPFLKRAFTNRSQARDESILLIMVKPTIIIEKEIEAQNFPLMSGRTN